jgi:hypothetical protein
MNKIMSPVDDVSVVKVAEVATQVAHQSKHDAPVIRATY